MAKIREEKIIVKFSVLLKDDQELNLELINEDLREELEQLAKVHIENQLVLSKTDVNVLVEASVIKDALPPPPAEPSDENTQ